MRSDKWAGSSLPSRWCCSSSASRSGPRCSTRRPSAAQWCSYFPPLRSRCSTSRQREPSTRHLPEMPSIFDPVRIIVWEVSRLFPTVAAGAFLFCWSSVTAAVEACVKRVGGRGLACKWFGDYLKKSARYMHRRAINISA